MTSIIFSISIGFIIFLVVIYKLQLESTRLLGYKDDGSYFGIYQRSDGFINPELLDPIIKRHSNTIEDFSYVSNGLAQDFYYNV